MKLAFVILALGFFVQSDDVRLTNVKINKDITVALPVNFMAMSENEARQKYTTSKLPIALYTSIDRKTDFGINIIPTQWQDADLDMLKSFYRSSFLNLYDSVTFIKEEIQQINNRRFLVFEFISTLRPDPEAAIRQSTAINYVYLQYTLVNGKMVLFTFTSPASQREKWQGMAERVMHSVKIKKTL
jgi:hypothetical protein